VGTALPGLYTGTAIPHILSNQAEIRYADLYARLSCDFMCIEKPGASVIVSLKIYDGVSDAGRLSGP
jgi:hypothetical protein